MDTGSATGSPPHGTVQSGFNGDTHYPTENNWKNADDNTENDGTAYSAAPIVAGNNSYERWLYGSFSGSFNEILNVVWSAHTAGTLGTGLSLYGTVTSSYTTPSTTANANLTTNFTSIVAIGSGLSVNLSTTGPYASSPTSTLTSSGYTQYLVSQLQTTTGASPGDTASITGTLQFSHN